MISRNLFFVLFCLISACSKNSTSDILDLPLDKKTIWVYEVKGYSSYVLNLGEKPLLKDELSDTTFQIGTFNDLLELDRYRDFSDTGYDTVSVFIENITYFHEDSIVFRFNIDFVRFWGTEILKVKNEYKSILGNGESHYLIKSPIKRNNHWKNKYTFVSEDCVIAAVDTTIRVRNNEFQRCVEITISRSMEGVESTIKMYFNEKQGLVYYRDESNQDELILIEMKTK